MKDIEEMIIKNDWATLSKVINNGFDVNTQDDEGQTPLMLAASYCKTDMVELLLSHKARTDITDFYGDTAEGRAEWVERDSQDIQAMICEASGEECDPYKKHDDDY